MGTLQQELTKVQTLDSLTFDDEPGGTVVTQDDSTEDKSTRQRVWEWLRDHPMSSAGELSAALGVKSSRVHSTLIGFYNAGALSRQLINGVYHYTTTSTTYPFASTRTEILQKAWARRAELAASGELKRRYKPREKKPPQEMQTPPTPKKKATPVAKVKAEQPAQEETIQMVPSYDPNVVSTWPVSMARAFYLELKKYFGEA
jgi:hypothetical protein